MNAPRTYPYYRDALAGHAMPLAFVDLELFDQNVRDIVTRASGKRMRIASKSVRCVHLLERILASDTSYRGTMAYSVREAVFLSHQGIDDILVAYPAFHELDESGLAEELRRGKRIVVMADCAEHVRRYDAYGKAFDIIVPVCLDIDMSSRYPGLHFGVLRSPVVTPDQAVDLARTLRECKHAKLVGIMGYEAQIAGLPDNTPGRPVWNAIMRALKARSILEVRERRARIVEALRADGRELEIVNGGGTGSIESTRAEDCVTEVTVGSGFFSPPLFDGYTEFRHLPAAGYAIEITRIPAPGVYTCHGGGYVASGTGTDKLPQPYLPQGARLTPREGAGEVQTPVLYSGPEKLGIGDPIIMRYSKAGEMCERFNSLLCIEHGAVTQECPTYRGEGQAFG